MALGKLVLGGADKLPLALSKEQLLDTKCALGDSNSFVMTKPDINQVWVFGGEMPWFVILPANNDAKYGWDGTTVLTVANPELGQSGLSGDLEEDTEFSYGCYGGWQWKDSIEDAVTASTSVQVIPFEVDLTVTRLADVSANRIHRWCIQGTYNSIYATERAYPYNTYILQHLVTGYPAKDFYATTCYIAGESFTSDGRRILVAAESTGFGTSLVVVKSYNGYSDANGMYQLASGVSWCVYAETEKISTYEYTPSEVKFTRVGGSDTFYLYPSISSPMSFSSDGIRLIAPFEAIGNTNYWLNGAWRSVYFAAAGFAELVMTRTQQGDIAFSKNEHFTAISYTDNYGQTWVADKTISVAPLAAKIPLLDCADNYVHLAETAPNSFVYKLYSFGADQQLWVNKYTISMDMSPAYDPVCEAMWYFPEQRVVLRAEHGYIECPTPPSFCWEIIDVWLYFFNADYTLQYKKKICTETIDSNVHWNMGVGLRADSQVVLRGDYLLLGLDVVMA